MKNSKFLSHYELTTQYNSFAHFILLLVFAFLSRWLFLRYDYYPNFLFSLDFPTFIISIIYLLVIKPSIKLHALKVYYRYKYSRDVQQSSYIYSIFAVTAVGRMFPYIRHITVQMILGINPFLFAIAIIVPLLLFYNLYYRDRFISAKRYTEGVLMYAQSCSDDLTHPNVYASAFMNKYRDHVGYVKDRNVKGFIDVYSKTDDPVLKEMFKESLGKTMTLIDGVIENKENHNGKLRRKNRNID